MNEPTRRAVVRRLLQAGASAALLPAAFNALAADSCVTPDSDGLRSSLHYVNPGPKPGEQCKGCGFFAGDAAKPACGNCQIMSGMVDATAHCDSWAAKG